MWSPFFLVAPPPSHAPHLLVSNPRQYPAAQPNRRRSLTALQDDGVSPGRVGELDHTLLTTLESNPGRPRQEGGASQISGSDVLWALQRASERKKKKKKKKQRREEESSPASSRREDVDDNVDYANVRPLRVNSEWGDKLDDLEKRLLELSEII